MPPASLGLVVLLCAAAGCGSSVATVGPNLAPPGVARIEVRFDPARPAPPDCSVLRFSYVATRTGDAAGAPAANVSAGVSTTDDWMREAWCPGREAVTFPDRLGIMQGTWDFSLTVTEEENNGALYFESTCSGVRIRSNTTHVILITQPLAGTSATCVFSL